MLNHLMQIQDDVIQVCMVYLYNYAKTICIVPNIQAIKLALKRETCLGAPVLVAAFENTSN